jgi:hypothetical protein
MESSALSLVCAIILFVVTFFLKNKILKLFFRSFSVSFATINFLMILFRSVVK